MSEYLCRVLKGGRAVTNSHEVIGVRTRGGEAPVEQVLAEL